MTDRRFPALDEINDLTERHLDVINSSGKPVVGWFCSYTPLEILMAAGLHPLRIIPEPGRAMTRADTYIDRNFCPYVRTCLGEALDGSYEFLDGLVVVNSCDPMRRLYDAWRYYVGGDFVYLLDLPRIDSDAAVAYYRERLQEFRGELEKHYKVTVSDQAITGAMAERNRIRSSLRELYRVNNRRGTPLAAAEVQAVVRASTVLPVDIIGGMLERLTGEVGGSEIEYSDGPRLLITGSVLDNPKIIELIEQYGARVVGDDLCTGTRQFWDVAEVESDSLTALSRHYLGRTPCPRMRKAGRRFEHIFRMIDEFRVDGIIFYSLKFCDPFLFDIPVLKEQLDEKGIPNLVLEGDYSPGTLGRVKTRIEAFVEMLKQDVKAI